MVLDNTIREEGEVGILVEGTDATKDHKQSWGKVPAINRTGSPNTGRYGTGATTWPTAGAGTPPTTDAPTYQFGPRFMRIPVEPSTWMSDEIGEYRDLSVSAVPAVDRQSISTTAQSRGSLAGPFDTVMPFYILNAFMGDNATVATPPQLATTGFYMHQAEPGRNINSLSIATSDGVVNSSIFYGAIPTNFKLMSNHGEGEVKWTADFMGRGSAYEDVVSAEQDYNFRIPRRDLPPRPFIGTSMRIGSIEGSISPRLMELELEFNREFELGWASGIDYARYANIQRAPSTTATFRATCEFQRVEDLWAYSKGRRKGFTTTPASTAAWELDDTLSEFFDAGNAQHEWFFRWGTIPAVSAVSLPWAIDAVGATVPASPTAVVPANTYSYGDYVSSGGESYRALIRNAAGNALDDTGQWINTDEIDLISAASALGTTGLDSSHGVFDVLLYKVSLGSDPIEVDRSESSSTFEFNGTAVFDTSRAEGGSQGKLLTTRLFNKKSTNYITNDNKAATGDAPQNAAGSVA